MAKSTSKTLHDREKAFLWNFYDNNSPTQGNKEASAVAAGYAVGSANVMAQRVIAKYRGKRFEVVADLMGMSNAYLAAKFKRIMDDPGTLPRDMLAVGKAVLAMRGEQTEGGRAAQTTVTVQTPRALIITGVDAKKIEAMTAPALPVAEPEEMVVEVSDAV